MNENVKYNINGVNGPILILDTKELNRDKNYSVGCDLFNEIAIKKKNVLPLAKVSIQVNFYTYYANLILYFLLVNLKKQLKFI